MNRATENIYRTASHPALVYADRIENILDGEHARKSDAEKLALIRAEQVAFDATYGLEAS